MQLPGFWKGIEGIVFCQGKDCEVESGESGGFKLTGSWYFTPNLDDLDKLYVKKADESGDYEPALYAKYGHWLTFDDGVATVNTYAMTDHDNKGAWTVSTEPDATTLKDTSASYSGKAAGMSVRETFKTDGTVEKTQSGAFTAKVSLTATFGSSPELVGKVSQFEGAAVNTDWSVTLEEEYSQQRQRYRYRDQWSSLRLRPGRRVVGNVVWQRPMHARREYTATSTPISRTAMPPGPTLPGSSNPKRGPKGVLDPIVSEGRRLRRPSFFRQPNPGRDGMQRTATAVFGGAPLNS